MELLILAQFAYGAKRLIYDGLVFDVEDLSDLLIG